MDLHTHPQQLRALAQNLQTKPELDPVLLQQSLANVMLALADILESQKKAEKDQRR
jgi:hypothetical protein